MAALMYAIIDNIRLTTHTIRSLRHTNKVSLSKGTHRMIAAHLHAQIYILC